MDELGTGVSAQVDHKSKHAKLNIMPASLGKNESLKKPVVMKSDVSQMAVRIESQGTGKSIGSGLNDPMAQDMELELLLDQTHDQTTQHPVKGQQ